MDPVIQIASMVQRQGEKEPFIRTVFTLQSCASIVGSQILCFTQEKQLLQVHYIHYTLPISQGGIKPPFYVILFVLLSCNAAEQFINLVFVFRVGQSL